MPANYLVPHDFTPVADCAVKYALQMARQSGANIHLFHVVKNDKGKAEAEAKFKKLVADLKLGPNDPKFFYRITKGSIFTDIAKAAEELKAALIIMGTHGAKGMQKVTGSFAIKVIKSTSCPFLVVQEHELDGKTDNICLPIDFNVESLQVMNITAHLAKTLGAEVHFLGPKESDRSMAHKITVHMKVVRKKAEDMGIKYRIELLDGSGSFRNKVVDYAIKTNADMFAIAYHSDSLLPQFDRFAQSMLENKNKVPVLIVNSKEVTSGYF